VPAAIRSRDRELFGTDRQLFELSELAQISTSELLEWDWPAAPDTHAPERTIGRLFVDVMCGVISEVAG
jgi:hypothetical protein